MRTLRMSWVLGIVGCESQELVEQQDLDELARCGDDDDDDDDDDPMDSILYPQDVVLEGQTLAEWNARWWEWLVSIPASVNPANGGPCDQNQDDDIFFLTGTFGGPAVVRECTVPAHTPIFLPTVTTLTNPCPDAFGAGECPYLDPTVLLNLAAQRQITRKPTLSYAITLDGVALTGLDDYHLLAELASMDYSGTEPSVLFYAQDQFGPGIPAEDTDCGAGLSDDNVCGLPAGPRWSASHGHGVAFKPLKKGEHVLHMTAARGQPGQPPVFSVDVTYYLTVE
jgi:hypothetical protein